MPDDTLELARMAYLRMAWADALALFSGADEHESLGPDDLERAAKAAELTGRASGADAFWQRAVHEYERVEDNERAAKCAFWQGLSLMQRGDMAQAGGWFARARRMLGDDGAESAVTGFLLIPVALQALFAGDAASARPTFDEILSIAERFGDTDLLTFGRLGLGQSLLRLGESTAGIASLDDAMLSVTAGDVSPLVAGLVYCAVLETCNALLDIRRAREWTEALSRWCDAQSGLVPFRGQCLIHRAEIMKARGAWADALGEVRLACDRLLGPPPQPAVADALYQKAELHRLRGEFAEAEEAYRATSQWGREPQPGLALLRLAQGQPGVAESAIRRVVAENQDPVARSNLLVAFIEVMLAVDDVAAARSASADLVGIASEVGAPSLQAMSQYSAGAVALADGDAHTAIAALRRAWSQWYELDVPYETARARVLIALACRELGDDDTATMELDVARQAFAHLGATPELARLESLTASSDRTASGGLTGREMQVLELVATGKTNRQIAEALFISEKTVARHISNIFTKLAVSSRAAATAYAYRHGLA